MAMFVEWSYAVEPLEKEIKPVESELTSPIDFESSGIFKLFNGLCTPFPFCAHKDDE